MRSSKRSQAPIAIIYACTNINYANLTQVSLLCCVRGLLRINFSKFVRMEMAKLTKGTTKSKAKGIFSVNI